MANYTKATNFTVKDTLTSGDPNKIVKGTEIDTEFIAIASAIASKADLASPAFTGVPTAPTALSTTNTAQIASTAFVQSVITSLNLGNMSTQNKTAVDITGGTIAGTTINNATVTGGTISGLSSPLAVADGGTGATSFTANRLLVGNGTGAIQSLSPNSVSTVLKLGLGITGETWNNVLGSRVANQTYTNSYSYPIMVNIQLVTGSSGYTNPSYIYVNGIVVARANSGGWTGATSFTCSVIVPPGSTYSTNANCISAWAELY